MKQINPSLSFRLGALFMSIISLLISIMFFKFARHDLPAIILFAFISLVILIYGFRRKIIIDKDKIIDKEFFFTDKVFFYKNITDYSLKKNYVLSGGKADKWNNSVSLILYHKNKELGIIDLSSFDKKAITKIDKYLKKYYLINNFPIQ